MLNKSMYELGRKMAFAMNDPFRDPKTAGWFGGGDVQGEADSLSKFMGRDAARKSIQDQMKTKSDLVDSATNAGRLAGGAVSLPAAGITGYGGIKQLLSGLKEPTMKIRGVGQLLASLGIGALGSGIGGALGASTQSGAASELAKLRNLDQALRPKIPAGMAKNVKGAEAASSKQSAWDGWLGPGGRRDVPGGKPAVSFTPPAPKPAENQYASWWEPRVPDATKAQAQREGAFGGGLIGWGLGGLGGGAGGFAGARHLTEEIPRGIQGSLEDFAKWPEMAAARVHAATAGMGGAMEGQKLDYAPNRLSRFLFDIGAGMKPSANRDVLGVLSALAGHKPFRAPLVLGGSLLAGGLGALGGNLIGAGAGSAFGGIGQGGYKGGWSGKPVQ